MPQDFQNRYYNAPEPRTSFGLASATQTASGAGTPFTVDSVLSIIGTLAVTAASGTSPTLDLRLESSVDGTNYYTVAAFSQKTGISTDARIFGPVGTTARWAWTVGGTTPSFTFSVVASADRDD